MSGERQVREAAARLTPLLTEDGDWLVDPESGRFHEDVAILVAFAGVTPVEHRYDGTSPDTFHEAATSHAGPRGSISPAEATALTDEEWREFQAIPDQGYSHRAWVDARIRQRLAAPPADADTAGRETQWRVLLSDEAREGGGSRAPYVFCDTDGARARRLIERPGYVAIERRDVGAWVREPAGPTVATTSQEATQ